jgi:hypothetical protein
MGADLADPVRGGFPPRRLQAGQQPVLRLQPALESQPGHGRRRRLLREPLPRGLLRHPDPLTDLGPRAPGVTRLGYETADQLIAAGRQYLTDRDRGLDPVQRRIRCPRPDHCHQRAGVQDLHTAWSGRQRRRQPGALATAGSRGVRRLSGPLLARRWRPGPGGAGPRPARGLAGGGAVAGYGPA